MYLKITSWSVTKLQPGGGSFFVAYLRVRWLSEISEEQNFPVEITITRSEGATSGKKCIYKICNKIKAPTSSIRAILRWLSLVRDAYCTISHTLCRCASIFAAEIKRKEICLHFERFSSLISTITLIHIDISQRILEEIKMYREVGFLKIYFLSLHSSTNCWSSAWNVNMNFLFVLLYRMFRHSKNKTF